MNSWQEARIATCERRVEQLLRLIRSLMEQLRKAQQDLSGIQNK